MYKIVVNYGCKRVAHFVRVPRAFEKELRSKYKIIDRMYVHEDMYYEYWVEDK